MPPNEFARSGFHSGETASGYFDESFSVTINGTDRTRKCDFESLEIEESATDSPNACHVDTHGFDPSEGHEIKIYNGGVDVGVPIFAGHLMEANPKAERRAERPTWSLVANDYRWLLDRFALVTKSYRSQGINVILADILANFTNGGFTYGYCPQSLGNISAIDFTFETVSNAIARLARAAGAGATARVDYKKRVSIAVTHDDEDNALALTDSATDFWDIGAPGDLSQVRTRVIYEGGGSETSVAVVSGASTIPVTNTTWYSSSGGTVRCETNLITYTGISTTSGAGSLTGCSGITRDIGANTSVNVYVQVDDAAAQTALATLLGGGASGIAVRYKSDGRLSLNECTLRATADLNAYSAVLNSVQYTTTNAYTRPGRTVSATLTKPRSLTATLLVQRVTLRGRRKIDGAITTLDRVVVVSPMSRQLADALAEAGVE